ncbi:MAG: hypothetical protein RTU30_11190 [Candidatus Thorarchaeota archaeon]
MSEPIKMEELVDRLLLIATLNSTLVHFLLSSQIEGKVDPDRVDSLTQGLKRTRQWMENATTAQGIAESTANIMGLIVKRLSQIEILLPKLSVRAKQSEATPTAEILSLLDDSKRATDPRLSSETVVSTASPASTDFVSVLEDSEEEPAEPYTKTDIEDDQWGFIGQNQRFIDQYSKRCHVLLPSYWLEVLKEIHKYQSKSPFMADIIETPSKIFIKVIKGLLTEAPGARLLQDLSKRRPQERDLMASEMERIQRAVANYFSGLENLLKGEKVRPKEKISEAQATFAGFDWGGPELEKRLIKRLNQRAEEELQAAEQASDPTRQVIHAEVSKLLCKLQLGILAEPRLREILAMMKP